MAGSSSRFATATATATVATVATVDRTRGADVAKIAGVAGVAAAVPRKLPFLSRLAKLMMPLPAMPG